MASDFALKMGIDTGGTYTDGVLFDPAAKRIIQSAKVLTTHADLTQCISEVIDRLLSPKDGVYASHITTVSLSTTLATNAIAEGKRQPVALFLLGYDPELIQRFQFAQQFGTPHYFYIAGRHNLDGKEITPLDEAALINKVCDIKDKVEAFAVASYAGSRNCEHEERAAMLIHAISDLQVVQAHHLTNELDSIRRATTASLNASLLSNTQDFLRAVELMLKNHHVDCPIMIVRGDGSVAKSAFVRQRPVEIIHSGPATSAIGGQYLANLQNGLVIDVGGTTTDIALVEKGMVINGGKSATVGSYRTCVQTIRSRSFGLGGDSRIRFDRHQHISVGPQRVLPISRLIWEFPTMRDRMLAWISEKNNVHQLGHLECWILRKPVITMPENKRTAQALAILQQGPALLPDLLKQVGVVSPVQLRLTDYIQQDYIEQSAFTPTDILHLQGVFTPWDMDVISAYTQKSADLLALPLDDFLCQIWRSITERISVEIIEFLSGKVLSEKGYVNRRDDLDRWLFSESIQPNHEHLNSRITLKNKIIGIGAPARAFLTDVADLLGTEAVFPDYYQVANAVGTIVGNVVAHLEGDVLPITKGANVNGYLGRVGIHQAAFEKFESARDFVVNQIMHDVTEDARAAGAHNPRITCEEHEIISGMMIKISALAISNL